MDISELLLKKDIGPYLQMDVAEAAKRALQTDIALAAKRALQMDVGVAAKRAIKGLVNVLNTPLEWPESQNYIIKKEIMDSIQSAALDGNIGNQPEHYGTYPAIEKTQAMAKIQETIFRKDPYTCGHGDRVGKYSVYIAGKMGCSEETMNILALAATVHDAGKLGIPEDILNKPGKLTKEEWNLMMLHPVIGGLINQEMYGDGPIVDISMQHHEKLDGSGYPGKLAGKDINDLSKMVAAADGFDAMTGGRFYNGNGLTEERVRSEIKNGTGIQFWAPAANALLENIDNMSWLDRVTGQIHTAFCNLMKQPAADYSSRFKLGDLTQFLDLNKSLCEVCYGHRN